MATGIHAIIQAKMNGEWCEVHSNWECDQHYMLFGWLADVRNGEGFEGIRYADPIIPLKDDKNHGMTDEVKSTLSSYDLEDYNRHSWRCIYVDEILQGLDNLKDIRRYKPVDPKNFMSNEVVEDGIYTKEQIKEGFKYFTDEVQRLKDKYGEVRLILSFDS